MIMIRTYSQLRKIKTYEERYKYLQLRGRVGLDTFGYDRFLNQLLYNSRRWKKIRDVVIIRDHGYDLGIEDYEIYGKIFIHHMNSLTIEDIESGRDEVFDPEFLISTSFDTHNAIHFGDESLLPRLPIIRTRNDTCPWK
jgi:hypothetical protein